MAQRFPVPNAGSNGPPPQRYPPPSVPPNLRQYSGPNFPVSALRRLIHLLIYIFARINCVIFTHADAAKIGIHSTASNGSWRTSRWHYEAESALHQHATSPNAQSSERQEECGSTDPHVSTETVSFDLNYLHYYHSSLNSAHYV